MKAGKVEISPGFLFLLAWLNYIDNCGMVFCAMLSCLAHELGHILVLRMLGNEIKYVRITIVGAEMRVSRDMDYCGELAAVLAGPAVNLVLAVVLCQASWGRMAAGLNLALALFNLLPVGRLDGGRALRCLLAIFFDLETAERVCRWCSSILILLGSLCGIWMAGIYGNITLALVSAWLLAAAGGEYEKRRWKKQNRGCQYRRKKVL